MNTFKFQDLYTTPAIPLDQISQQISYGDNTVDYVYNSHGYRTHDFNSVSKHIVVSGCSHTEGTGLYQHQSWPAQFEKLTGTKVFNLGKSGASAEFVSQNLQNWIRIHTPELVVVQWPNPYRSLSWKNGQAVFNLNSNHDEIYQIKIKYGDENFYHQWCNSIIALNQQCNQRNIPLVNICFESYDVLSALLPIVQQFGITIHYDQKTPGQTWFFDNGALDQAHHSEWCNTKWTERLLTICKTML